jgi:hypothetical protein
MVRSFIFCTHLQIIRQIKSRRMRWAGHVARMGEERKVYWVLVGKPEGERPLGRLRRRWEDGIRMDLREMGWRGLEWIQLAQDRDRLQALVNTVVNFRVLSPHRYLSLRFFDECFVYISNHLHAR